jgi:hypothetical protein
MPLTPRTAVTRRLPGGYGGRVGIFVGGVHGTPLFSTGPVSRNLLVYSRPRPFRTQNLIRAVHISPILVASGAAYAIAFASDVERKTAIYAALDASGLAYAFDTEKKIGLAAANSATALGFASDTERKIAVLASLIASGLAFGYESGQLIHFSTEIAHALGFARTTIRKTSATTAVAAALVIAAETQRKTGAYTGAAIALVSAVDVLRKSATYTGARAYALPSGVSIVIVGGATQVSGVAHAFVYARATLVGIVQLAENWEECETDLTLATKVIWPL